MSHINPSSSPAPAESSASSEAFLQTFPDIQTHWARPFIEGLTQRGVVRGFDDGTFRPEAPTSRAEFAALLRAAFPKLGVRPYMPFGDIAPGYWAAGAVQWAYETAFLSGYPGNLFRPLESIPRVQALVSLASGLGLTTAEAIPLAELYHDSREIATWAMGAIAACTDARIIVNYPDRTRLHPNQPATRAEIAAFIYQCLVHQGSAPDLDAPGIVSWVRLVEVSHRREFRGAWIATVWNIDFPSQRTLTVAQQQSELSALLDKLQAMKFNAVFLQVRPEGDALYASSLEPWSFWLTGTQGKAPNPTYDLLEWAIAQCHRRNLELHAWFNPYRARTSAQTVHVLPHAAITDPSVVYPWGNQMWMDPGSAAVQERTYRVILDVVRRYDLDGIHLDDYFYPYPIAGQEFPDHATYQAYQSQGGKLARADWRRDNVNRLVQRLAEGIRSAKPWVKFGISPFGIYRPGQPPQIQGLDAYNQLYADALKWLQAGWVDYLAPQLYWRIDSPGQSYMALLDWWLAQNSRHRHIYPGNNLALLKEGTTDTTELERQVNETRDRSSRLALGNIFYSMKSLATNRAGFGDRLSTQLYAQPALPPTMPWLSTASATPVTSLRGGQRLMWTAPAPRPHAYSLYRVVNDQWQLQQLLPATATSLEVSAGTYALCAVNRLAQESRGAIAYVR
ncbi:MAG: family 10 glycosylhydrolase [Kaiparowitsia implicata GSE-PSE-MK54-09C]|jgi:uncharacterized lipoprotein YddW (UPF0748 family)|nr:family 10 glycosylhydrolase [Kaiparowitsia implicata GSE-PSE-MK54-09C]